MACPLSITGGRWLDSQRLRAIAVFFPMNSSLIEAFKNELKMFETSKGTIRFALDKPLPAALLKQLVKARVAENERKQKR